MQDLNSVDSIHLISNLETSLPRVVVISSEPKALFSTTSVLYSKYDFDCVIWAKNMESGASGSFESKPDAVIVDVDSIDERLDEMMADLLTKAGEGTPIIILSEFVKREAVFKLGASTLIRKPFAENRLMDVLDLLVGSSIRSIYRVMIVDDDVISLEIAKAILMNYGIEVLALESAKMAFDQLDRFNPDLLVLDVYMPELSGPEFVAKLRSIPRFLQTPILFLSSETDELKQMEFLKTGGDDFIEKPINKNFFLSKVIGRIERYHSQISYQTRLQRSLYEMESLRTALDQHAIVSTADIQGNILDLNEKFCEVSGYDRSFLIGKNHSMISSGIHSNEFFKDMWQTILSGKTWHGDICNRHRSGTLYWVAASITPLMNSDNQPHRFIAILTEITKNIRMQEQLKEKEHSLNEAQAIAHVGGWEVDIDNGVMEWSDEVYRILRLKKSLEIPSIVIFEECIHADDLELFHVMFDEVIINNNKNVSTQIRVKDCEGNVIHVRLRVVKKVDKQTVGSRIYGTIQDITEEVKAHNLLQSTLQEAQKANQAKSEFLSIMSHELRTPMNAIIGFGQILEMDETLASGSRECLDEIKKASDHLLNLIDDILDLSTIESGNVIFSLEGFRVQSFFDECVKLVMPLTKKNSIHLLVASFSDKTVFADKTCLRQVVLNLLSNAIKYNRQEGSVILECEQKPLGMIRISVKDTGIGIAADKINELFQPFSRLNRNLTSIEGTGIGLALVKRLVEGMNGSVGVESVIGKGSSFWVELPQGNE